MDFSRRAFIAAVPGAAAVAAMGAPAPARAAAPAVGKQVPAFYRFKVGDFEVTALLDGVTTAPINPQRIPNVPVEDVRKAMESQFMPVEPTVNYFTQMTVNTGSKLVLIDAGFADNGAPTTGQLRTNMAAAGIDPKQIDTLLVSHFHGDHINGIRVKDGAAAYANAEIALPGLEWDFWMDDARMNAAPEAGRAGFMAARRVFNPIAKDVRKFEWGKEVAPGITAIKSDGHTVGHTSFVVSSGTKSLMVVGDACNDPRLFARNPEWHLVFDTDKPLAVATRKRLLDMAAADRMQVVFYHAAFPATGYVSKTATGYDWHPAQFSPAL
jgi:glyoxylase-like metal-dependent hydrolase (beta-lactamase superfamily II)